MIFANVFLLSLLFYDSLSLKPLFLIPGFQNSPLYGTVSNYNLYPECPRTLNHTFIDFNFNSLIKENPRCAAKLIQTHINEKTDEIEHLPGIKIESSPFGDYNSLKSFSKFISKIIKFGYKEQINLFGVGYDWSLFPFEIEKEFSKLKNSIEKIFKENNEKAILLGHDLGSQFISLFISNFVNQEWSQKYIDSIIFVAPTIGGCPIPNTLMKPKLDILEHSKELEKSIMMMPSLHILLPNYNIFGNEPIITKQYGNYKSYNSSTIIDFLKSRQIVDDEAEKVYKLVAEKYLKKIIPEPSVPSFIIYNDAIETHSKYSIILDEDSKSHVLTALNHSGDGLIWAKGAQYLCGHWKSSKCLNINQQDSEVGGHFSMLSSSTVIDRIIDYIINNKSTSKEKPKKAFFISPGFSASPLFATVTNPKEIPECPSNLNFYQFFYPILDGVNRSKLSGECVAMLTRAMLQNEDKIVFAPGVFIESSPFGDYEKLRSIRTIISRAYDLNYTHYKDLFGVGYNFMMHPLMSDQIYSQLKSHIEKYYEETGMKSVIVGHSQGSSFMHIFITHYVSKEWAMKYIDSVIFLAPAFAGWATYWRLIEGKFSYQMPDNLDEFHKSVSRMPGLHIMLPNEAVFGDKTVISNFPKKGDMANATFASELLKKQNRMDDTSFKIFKLTDKYRKNPLIEPSVPSLVIYNDNVTTPITYDYNPENNSVLKIFGPGDRVVSDDGPKYACKNWKNVKCINFHNNFDHSKMLHEKQLIDAIFDFIDENKKYQEIPKSIKTASELDANNYTLKLNIEKEADNNEAAKSKFFIFVNMGILVSSIIITYVILAFLCFNCLKLSNEKKKKPRLTMRDNIVDI